MTKKLNESGQILILVFAAMGVVLFTVLFLIGGSQLYFQNSQYAYKAEAAAALAEAGVDKALASLNETGGAYNGEAETTFGDGSYSVIVTNKDAGTKILQVTGYVPNKTSPKAKRTITIQASKGDGISFFYGMQIGDGGLEMGNGNTIKGNIYSNGSIQGGEGNIFGETSAGTGDIRVAGASQTIADQQSDCYGLNCQDYIFGRNVGGENRQDVAQSFKPSPEESHLNKVSLKIKRVGSPANLTVRIMGDSGGKPNKNAVLATGTLATNLVTTEYPTGDFIGVTFNTSPELNSSASYWIMLHSQALDNSNYWIWSLDLAQGYNQGVAKWSPNWQSGSPVWTSINGDLGFKVYLGGGPTSVQLGSNSIVNGTVYANTITGNMTIKKDAYYQTLGPFVVVQGIKYPGSADPPPTVFPISDPNITEWKNQAEAAGITNTDITGCPATLGPGKIDANVSIGNTCSDIKVFSPVWITGTFNVGNTIKFVLDQSFGAASGLIIVDGTTQLGNSVEFEGSGTEGSYIMLLSTYNTPLNGGKAINTGNSSRSGIMYAPFGSVELDNGSIFRELTAWKIEMGNGGTLDYQSGLASTFFSAGPGGTYSLIKGTYQIK